MHMADVSGFEDAAAYDEFVPYDKAKAAFPDWEAFVKRNRLNEDADAVYLEKIKKEDDLELLRPLAERRCTGWVVMERVPEDRREEAKQRADDAVTGWDCLDFDEMNGMCGSCPLSWDKGRGCIGAFGPDNSLKICTNEAGEFPEVPPATTTTQYGQSDFDITMTNEYLPTDDGTNVNTLIQQNSYDGLFNGKKSVNDRDFEFKWDLGSGVAQEVTLPTTIHFFIDLL